MPRLTQTHEELQAAINKTATDGITHLKGDPANPVDGDKRTRGTGFVPALEVYDGDASAWILDGTSIGGLGITLDEQVIACGTGNSLATRLRKDPDEIRIGPYYTWGAAGEIKKLTNTYIANNTPQTLETNTGTTDHPAVLDGDVYKLGIPVSARLLNYFILSRSFTLGNTAPTAPVYYSAYEATDAADDTKLLIARWLPSSVFDSAVAGDVYTYTLVDAQSKITPISESADTAYYVQLESAEPFSLYGDATQPTNSTSGLQFVEEVLKTDCNCPFGNDGEYWQSLDESTSTSVFTDKVAGTSTEKEAGTYLITFGCEVTETSNSCEIRMMVDGENIHHHTTGNEELEPNLEDYNWQPIYREIMVTITEPHTFSLAIQFKDSGTAKMSDALIKLVRWC